MAPMQSRAGTASLNLLTLGSTLFMGVIELIRAYSTPGPLCYWINFFGYRLQCRGEIGGSALHSGGRDVR